MTEWLARASSVSHRKPVILPSLTCWPKRARSASLVSVSTWMEYTAGALDFCSSSSACVLPLPSSCPTTLANSGLLATITILRMPPPSHRASVVGISTIAAITAGIRSVKIKKERERTLARYSRFTSVQTLRMGAHLVDENFLQRGLQELKTADAHAVRD